MAELINVYPVDDTPSAFITLRPGTSSPGGAPVKFKPGASLTVPENGAVEYDGTHLYVTIAGARLILDLAKLLTAKGDLLVATASGVAARLAIGANGQVLVADSAQAAGMKWANPGAGSVAFSGPDKLLGRVTQGAGAGEEIPCTAAGRALLDDADAATQRTTLGLGDAATRNVGTGEGDVAAGDHVHAAGAKTEDVPVLAPDGATTRTLHFVNGQYTGYTDGSPGG